MTERMAELTLRRLPKYLSVAKSAKRKQVVSVSVIGCIKIKII